MKNLFVLFFVLFIGLLSVACGSSESGGKKACKSSLECSIGEVCSDGECVANSSSEQDDGKEIPDSGNDNDAYYDSDSNSSDDDGGNVSDSAAENDKDTGTDDSDEDDSDTESLSGDDSDEDEITPDGKCEGFISKTGCVSAMESEYPDYCDGFDNDCDGKVDEGCPCKAGETQVCFSGNPAQRGIGTCADGVQSCRVIMKGTVYGNWGECKGDILPKEDICDNADNNCNGCTDEGLLCSPKINCGYKIGDALPFVDKIIDGTKIYEFTDTDKVTWEWSLSKSPCDVVLGKTSFSLESAVEGVSGVSTDAAESMTFSGVGLSQLKLNFKLSGNYTLHLKVTRENGEIYECEWKLKVASDGLRVELCWDTTGVLGADVDLHLGKNGVTTAWGDIRNQTDNLACYYGNCKYDHSEGPDWGYEETENYDQYGNKGMMRNPRLDMDNLITEGKPENINLDNPGSGDTFRVLVHRFHKTTTFETHPVVNIYCGGTLKATYGIDPELLDFKHENDSWEVVEIKWIGGYSSDKCELTPKWDNGYVVTESALPNYMNW